MCILTMVSLLWPVEASGSCANESIVGGKILQMAIDKLNTGARIAICGDISNYNTTKSDDSKFYANDNQNGITVRLPLSPTNALRD